MVETILCVLVDGMNMSLDIDDGNEDEIWHFENCSFSLTVRGDEEFRALLDGLTGVIEALKRRKTIEAIEFESRKMPAPEAIDKPPIDKEALKDIFTEEAKPDD